VSDVGVSGSAAGGAGTASGKPRFPWWLACLLFLGSVAFLLAGALVYGVQAPAVSLVRLQWAGSGAAANSFVHPLAYGSYREAIYWDLGVLIPGYVLGLAAACVLGRRVFWTSLMRTAAYAGLVAAVVAGVCNVVQDVILLLVLRHAPMSGIWPFRAAAALSFMKFTLLLVAGGIGLIALATTIGRAAWHHHTSKEWKRARGVSAAGATGQGSRDCGGQAVPGAGGTAVEPGRRVIPPPPTERTRLRVAKGLAPDVSWWMEHKHSVAPGTHWAEDSASPGDVEPGVVGVCVSGGGIRSATVALGALQSLSDATGRGGRQSSVLGRARYLVSVSGGGYTAGAYQLALHASAKPDAVGDVFAPGSVEEDHLRRHSSYIADTLGQWLMALGVLFRCVATGVVVIGLVIVTIGVAIGRFYRQIPIITRGLAGLRPLFLVRAAVVTGKHKTPAPGWPAIPWGVTLAVLAVLLLAVVVYLIQVSSASGTGRRASQAGKWLIGLTVLLAVLGVGIPALIWLSSWVSWHVGFSRKPVIAVGSLSVIVGYLGALAGTLWQKRTTITKTTGAVTSFFTKSPGGQVLPSSMTQMLLLWIVMAVLVAGAVLASGWVATSGLDTSWWALLPIGVLLLVAAVADETWLSLYPFYRRRLASAFAVERATNRSQPPTAKPLPADTLTPLSCWGAKVDGFPEVRFATTANLSGQDRTPPGRRAVSYMLTDRYVGGPQAGWIRTDFLEALASPAIGRDIDVQAAMAISGAAFAAAMGRQTRFFEVFLALTNVRLGAWLPNPYFVAIKDEHLDDWTVPGLPSRRRLSHWAREIFGIHPSWARMLLCTDGGHYDNLGLMELLRLRCATIYCFDASGGGVPLADTLAGTMSLAREELGVDIDLSKPLDLVPGGIEPPPFSADGPLASLNARMSKTAIITGTITYPAPNPGTGTLIFAQATLTKDLPYHVLEYSQDDRGFPRDGTADQWFNADMFDAYQQLGRYLGDQAKKTRVRR
jgi:hypothetical protein